MGLDPIIQIRRREMRKNRKGLIGLILGCLVFGQGCAGMKVGTKVTADQASKIEKGKSTEKDIVNALGKPDGQSIMGSKKILSYNFSHSGASVGPMTFLMSLITFGLYTPVKVKNESTSLTVTIENGVVTDYSYSESGGKGTGY
jgi:hypothetical protein